MNINYWSYENLFVALAVHTGLLHTQLNHLGYHRPTLISEFIEFIDTPSTERKLWEAKFPSRNLDKLFNIISAPQTKNLEMTGSYSPTVNMADLCLLVSGRPPFDVGVGALWNRTAEDRFPRTIYRRCEKCIPIGYCICDRPQRG